MIPHNVQNFLFYLLRFAIKMILDNCATCYCFHGTVVSIVMSLKIMTKHCFVKRFKTKKAYIEYSLL